MKGTQGGRSEDETLEITKGRKTNVRRGGLRDVDRTPK